MIINFCRHERRTAIEHIEDLFIQTVMEVFPDQPIDVLELAIGAGRRALERGENFMDSMLVAENIIDICRVREEERLELMAWRNRDRLTEYHIKLVSFWR